jgi:hypothetical protein
MDKDYGDRKSSKKGGQTSPEYHETFEWNNIDSLNNMVLKVKVMDDDPAFDGTSFFVCCASFLLFFPGVLGCARRLNGGGRGARSPAICHSAAAKHRMPAAIHFLLLFRLTYARTYDDFFCRQARLVRL